MTAGPRHRRHFTRRLPRSPAGSRRRRRRRGARRGSTSVSLRITSTDSGTSSSRAQQLRDRRGRRDLELAARVAQHDLHEVKATARRSAVRRPRLRRGPDVMISNALARLHLASGTDDLGLLGQHAPGAGAAPSRSTPTTSHAAGAFGQPRRRPVVDRRRRRLSTRARQIRRISTTVWRFLPLRRPSEVHDHDDDTRHRGTGGHAGALGRLGAAVDLALQLAELRLDVRRG